MLTRLPLSLRRSSSSASNNTNNYGLRTTPRRSLHNSSSLLSRPGFSGLTLLEKKSEKPGKRTLGTAVALQNVEFLEKSYEEWKRNPEAFHPTLSSLFQILDSTPASIEAKPGDLDKTDVAFAIDNSMKLLNFIRAHQVRGHLVAEVDPLRLHDRQVPSEMTIEHYGWAEADLDRPIYLGNLTNFSKVTKVRTLRDVRDHLKKVYCGTVGIEYMHIQDRARCNWIRERFEDFENKYPITNEDKKNILDRLGWADTLEKFLHRKFASVKRYGLDGCEVLVAGLKTLVDELADRGVNDVVIGMPHRGRLNVLCNMLKMPFGSLFRHFDPEGHKDCLTGFTGDVKYHIGASCDRTTDSGKQIHLSLLTNPSHLEAVDPVVMGKTRARQFALGDDQAAKQSVLPLLIHGDAAFSAQGVVYECFDMAHLPNYGGGGNIHVVVNNQIGYTTEPKFGRSWTHPTEVAKTVEALILHVNADDPEAVIRCFKMAAEWRQTYGAAVVVDLYCYRRFGHNEVDQPGFTQPLMYSKINKQPSTFELYTQKLLTGGVVGEAEVKQLKDKITHQLNEAFEKSSTFSDEGFQQLNKWSSFNTLPLKGKPSTGVSASVLQSIGKTITTAPSTFSVHPTLNKILEQRRQMINSGEQVDWATAEQLAFGSLLQEGIHVRLSGQDVERGTFSHRHAVWNDQKNGAKYLALNNLNEKQSKIVISNSSLSEFGVLGFEFGYSVEDPNQLILWEAQFGDFANGAQIIIDQFISSAEAKWKYMSGLVMLLPHGYEGQGPEHSSAKLERFLQLHNSNPFNVYTDESAQMVESNFQVVNITTPANYFHVLRRQIHKGYRKPLIVMSPKSLLKHRLCISSLKDFEGTFQSVIPEVNANLVPDANIKRVLFCSGKVYYDLLESREKQKIKDVAIVRVEQIAPFPFNPIMEQLKRYPAAEIAWVQEEPMNMGGWNYVYHHFGASLAKLSGEKELKKKKTKSAKDLRYIGREPSAATSTGFHSVHLIELAKFLEEALH